ncbi:hypothetical protein C3L23_02795 [Nautilia sp. PV-1]|uniref:TIGR03545 family protein n=1 Tax=Nautilia sp. PV-1 TaxID=2579250 RepID=UPI000FD8C903|nr:TIGR03545 family protein [Nautilia sp. PV-1]AZV46236.1 hypothetical protein C3L23_02795 [Nautilia sp. PV-1]
MGFFFKLIRELNSSNNEKFITLALVLGLISGFLPFFNIFTLSILFLAFILRIPFGLYLASWGVFSIVGYFLDPVFAKTGYYILTAPFLTPLWEFIYNLPFMRWSGYNNTVVMGGLFWGVAIGIFLYFVLNKSIKIYRDKIFAFCSKYKYLKWIVPGEVKKKGIIRVSGIAGFIIIFGGLFLLISLTFDPFVKMIMQYSMSKIFKKPVKIEKLNTSFFKADVDIKNMYIGSVKTEHINLKLSWDYLVWRKFDIKNLQITDIHSEKTLKEIASSKSASSAKASNSSKFKLNISIPDPKQLLQGYQLESLQKIDKLKKDYEDFIDYANSIKKTVANDKTQIEKIKKEINNLSNTAKNIKSAGDIQNIIAQSDKIKNEIQNMQKDIKDKKDRLAKMKQQIINDLNAIKKAGQNDYTKLSKKYDLLKSGKYYQFAESFLKPQVQVYVNKILKYYKLAKPYISKSKKEENRYVRSKGRYIVYKDKIKYPDFVLENADVSASLKDADFIIKLKNISSDQTLLAKKGLIRVDSLSDYYKKAYLEITYLKQINIRYLIKNMHFENFKYNRFVLHNVNIDVDGKGFINGPKIVLSTNVLLIPGNIEYNGNKYVSRIVKNIKKVNLNIIIDGKIDDFKIKIKSNIDKLFSKLLKSELNKQIAEKKSELQSMLNEKIQKQIKETGFDSNKLGVLKDLDSLNGDLNSLTESLKQYSQKELQKQLLKKGVGNFINF